MYNTLSMKKILFFVFSVFISGVLFLSTGEIAQAANASLYLSPANGTNTIGSGFWVNVMVNTDGAEVNTAGGKISFDANKLEVTSLSTGGSVLNLWIKSPVFSNKTGTISFSGGTPSPFNGRANKLFTINFKTKQAGSASVNFVSGTILANDGKGTNILTGMGNGIYTISPKAQAPKKEDKKEIDTKKINTTKLKKDIIKEINKDKEVAVSYNKPKVMSETHPDSNKWYREKNVKFNWELPKEVEGVSILLNQKEISDPGPVSDGLFSSKEYKDVKDGVSYLHLKFKDKRGWGAIEHFKIQIDSTPPDSKIEVKQDDITDWPTIYFESNDEISGIAKYELFLDSLSSEVINLKASEDKYKLSNIGIGNHSIAVKVMDNAGYEKFTKINFTVNPIKTPTIKDYSHEIRSSSEFFITGNAPKNATIKIFIQQEDKEDKIIKETKSDGAGNWFSTLDQDLENGRYYVWAQAINKNGIESIPTFKASFLITPPIFAKIGSFVINYFTVLVSLIFMIILIIVLLTMLVEFLRKKLKKETYEIETVLEKNIKEFEKEINKEFTALGKLNKTEYTKEKLKMKKRLINKIQKMGDSIAKEVQDVEKILK